MRKQAQHLIAQANELTAQAAELIAAAETIVRECMANGEKFRVVAIELEEAKTHSEYVRKKLIKATTRLNK